MFDSERGQINCSQGINMGKHQNNSLVCLLSISN